MQQQFPGTQRIHVVTIALFVGADVGLVQEHFAVVDLGVAFLQADLARPDGFDFRAGQNDTCFVAVFDEVIVVSPLIVGDEFLFFHSTASFTEDRFG